MLALLPPSVDYVNLTVGMRGSYVRDMATEQPPLLADVAALRALTDRPLLVAQAFRDPVTMQRALAAGADLVGVARALIADPDLPLKVLDRSRAGGPTVRRVQRGLPHLRADPAVHRGSRPRRRPANRRARRSP